MDNVNKIISFILGLIVVVVFIAIVTGKFKIGSGLKNLTKAKVTPTVTAVPTTIPTKGVTITYNTTPQATSPITAKPAVPTYTSTTKVNTVIVPTTVPVYKTVQTPGTLSSGSQLTQNQNMSTIPNTGAETLLLPSALAMLGSGVFLKRKSYKK